MAQAHDVALLAYQPLASGVLTGKYKRGEDLPPGSRLTDAAWGDHYAQKYLSEGAFKVLDVLAEMAADKACTVGQLAVAWVLAQPGVTSVIIGPRTLEHLEGYLGALDVELSEPDLVCINEVAPAQ